LGQVSWFFGNLYEAMVDMPQLLLDAQQQRRPGLMNPGSPLRYYAPVAPLTIVATTAALVDSWRSGGDRRMIVAAAVNTAVAVAVTGYLVRTVNVRLLSGAMPLDSSERQRMIRTWQRANGVRMTAVAGAWLTVRRAARSAH
jgi:mannose/fructose/N-acetylgalactosamine-specific phosphotransferase system component IIC